MRTYDLSPLYRTTVGFDQFADLFDRAFSNEVGTASYPPFNIEKTSENAYRISVAVAGLSEKELSVNVHGNQLVVSARKSEEDEGRVFLHRGIAQRAFEKKFQLADHMIVTGAKNENGMLHIYLKREIPEALKPRQIKISTVGENGSQISNATKVEI